MSPIQTRRVGLRCLAFFGAASGLTRSIRARRRRKRDHRLYILEYHDVAEDGSEFEGTISQSRFQHHLDWLKPRFQITTLAKATEMMSSEANLDHDLVIVTFDDGYEGNYTGAWPVLQTAGVPATIFLTTGFLDGEELWFDRAKRSLCAAQTSPESLSEQALTLLFELYGSWPQNRDPEELIQTFKYLAPERRQAVMKALVSLPLACAPPARPLSWDQVRSMQQEGGIEFGGHTVTHPILSLLPKGRQEEEIVRCHRRIRDETGAPPRSFAYPNGSTRDYTDETVEIVRRAGYQAACTTRKGSNRFECDPLTLFRLGIGSDPLWVLEARLSGLFDEGVRRLLKWPIPGRAGS